MVKEIKDMTNKELVQELEGIEQHIDLFAYGRYELMYREKLYKEIENRGIKLQATTKFKIV